jgi:hypothetical protein
MILRKEGLPEHVEIAFERITQGVFAVHKEARVTQSGRPACVLIDAYGAACAD